MDLGSQKVENAGGAQSDGWSQGIHWVATEKTKRWRPALPHAVLQMLPFLLLTRSQAILLVVGGTHGVIDRCRVAKH